MAGFEKLHNFQQQLKKDGVEAAIVTSSNNLFYLTDFFAAAAQVAFAAKAQKIVMGVSGNYGANEQMEYMVMAWAALPEKYNITAEILWPGREVSFKF